MSKVLKLNETNTKEAFEFKKTTDFIKLHKIIFTDIIGEGWYTKLVENDLYLEIIEYRTDNTKHIRGLNLTIRIGPEYVHPIIEFDTEEENPYDIHIPSGNFNNTSKVVFYNKAEIQVKSTNGALPEKFTLTIYFK